MTDEIQPYENTLSIEELRREIRFEWDQKHALVKALRDLPEVPPTIVLHMLGSAGKWPEDKARGTELQRKHGSDAIPFKSEYETAAGLWSLIRFGVMIGRSERIPIVMENDDGTVSLLSNVSEVSGTLRGLRSTDTVR